MEWRGGLLALGPSPWRSVAQSEEQIPNPSSLPRDQRNKMELIRNVLGCLWAVQWARSGLIGLGAEAGNVIKVWTSESVFL